MSTSVLGSVTLGYTLLWNQRRQRCGVRLSVEPENASAVDAEHLLASIAEWSAPTPITPLLLGVQSGTLLSDLLQHTPVGALWLEIDSAWLTDAAMLERIHQAQQRGLHMVWRGQAGQVAALDTLDWFHKTLHTLSPHEALYALREALHQQHSKAWRTVNQSTHTPSSPVLRGALYEGLASQALVEHALDQQGAWGVLGWPCEEVLYSYRLSHIQPARDVLLATMQALEQDQSLETIESLLCKDPLLAYRFLCAVGSLGSKRDTAIGSVHHGVMVLGYSGLRRWLLEQLPHASSDANLEPIRHMMVLRGRVMQELCNAGIEDDLRREVFLCGMFSQIDLLLGETLESSLQRLHLPPRVGSAILQQGGPYAAWLATAAALESGSPSAVRDVSRKYRIDTATINRALLRSLAPP